MTDSFRDQLNKWGRDKVPFLFVVDFEMEKPLAWPLAEVDPSKVLFDVRGLTNAPRSHTTRIPTITSAKGSFESYRPRFEKVMHHLSRGDSFLTNLTVATPIELQGTLLDCFYASHAPYKLWLNNECVVFSPESFVRIEQGHIFSYPMKGTIDATIPQADQKILNDPKEMAEHVTIVDLIRNDLSGVATDVAVTRFRYLEEVKTQQGTLLQVSSEIAGKVNEGISTAIGDLLQRLLPAGSISGAPKKRTVEIIQEAEGEKRGYYTGVFGIYDGEQLDSAVMIRYVEHNKGQYFYRSGGGITTQSDAWLEWEETQKKIYVPIH